MSEQTKKVTQSMLIADIEIGLLKSVFADNDDLLRLVKNLFFGLELNQDEKNLILLTFKADDIRLLMSKRFIPEIAKETPIGQTVDMWTGIQVKEKPEPVIYQLVATRAKSLAMLKVALNLLVNPDGVRPNLNFDPELSTGDLATLDNALQINLAARNEFISFVETQLIMIKAIAGIKEETVEQAKTRLTKDSNK